MVRRELKSILESRAAHYFSEGYNCCQSVLLAANDTWDLSISRDLITAGRFFEHGMGSGSTCGALVGAQMALGILNERMGTNLTNKSAHQLYAEFVKTFASCQCRELRKKQSFADRIGYKGCKRITLVTAGILYELWEKMNGKEYPGIGYYSDLK